MALEATAEQEWVVWEVRTNCCPGPQPNLFPKLTSRTPAFDSPGYGGGYEPNRIGYY